jgi:hypothetical protein
VSTRSKANRDASGIVGYRAWLYAEDEHGTRIPATPSNFEGMQVKETRTYVSAPSTTRETIEERTEREGLSNRIRASLTEREVAVLKAQGKLCERLERRMEIYAGELEAYQRNGYTLIPGTAHMVEREGLPDVECVEVFGYEVEQVEKLDYQQTAELLGLTFDQVKYAVKSANKKLRKLGVQ